MFKKFTVAAAALLLCAGLAHAADDCDKQAADKKLAGAAKTNFVKKCSADAASAAPAAATTTATVSPAAAGCEKAAGEKKLAGAAKSSYLKKCAADGGPAAVLAAAPAPAPAPAVVAAAAPSASAGCVQQAADKKLAGAAKTSFVKKCTADAK
jgi:hypothetical protein